MVVKSDAQWLRTRREFLQQAAASCAAVGLSAAASGKDKGVPREAYAAISPRAQAVRDKVDWQSFSGMKHIRGFNYQPSWGHDAPSIWLEKFDAKRYTQELALGRKYFPAFNCVRIWLGYGAYRQNPALLRQHFNAAIKICTELELLVTPVLFTVWTAEPPFDPLSPKDLVGQDFERAYGRYLEEIVGAHRGNPSILMWDLCNEPWEGNILRPELQAQAAWLKFLHQRVKAIDAQARTCIGTVSDAGWGQSMADYCDALTPHLYGYPLWKPAFDKGQIRTDFETWMNGVVGHYVLQARALNRTPKPILSSETCWGAADNQERKHVIRATLGALRSHGVGFLPHALYTSGVADLHYPKGGDVPYPGLPDPRSMAFINADGTLRPGHEVFNEFAKG